MCKFVNNAKHGRIDKCIRNFIENLQWILGTDFKKGERIGSHWKIVACCCGHGKYPLSIIVKSPEEICLEIVSDVYIDRTKRFYKKDEQGYYYIPEVNESVD